MDHLYAPWRSNYTDSTERAKNDDGSANECVFCASIQKNDDDKHLILRRFEHNCIMFNRYPYNAGHLLIVPLEHIAHLENLPKAARTEMMEIANASATVMQKASNPHGFNIGFNLGKASGGSIPSHLHMHVLPRWTGDTNFLLTLGDTKVISTDMIKFFNDLKPHFAKITL